MALFDRLETEPRDIAPVECLIWSRREIENYLCSRDDPGGVRRGLGSRSRRGWDPSSRPRRRLAVAWTRCRQTIADDRSRRSETLGKGSPWSVDVKVSDDFLTPLFEEYFGKLGLPNLMAKKNFYELADYVPEDQIDPEIGDKLEAIASVAERAAPRRKTE